ncbi:AraC family transcriptional regulator [Dyadobacter sp. CY356]|uniref:helix-turn-helix domain-containing protein n=1 Tax=Dyadobacter sp. CY356 TaxID=2906442 RepID=UPI001F312FE0|nr:AraC family transcriptional regulator [Dyadobacter sp. CY356]MCF0055058.1 AraC family transcriptional regulator [Dyadobacter sp. CY356]
MNNPLLIGMTCGAVFLLAFLLIEPPGHKNLTANRWLAVFAATLGCAMLEIFLHTLGLQNSQRVLMDMAEVTRFISAPALYLSIVSFVTPAKRFKFLELLHLLPFVIFLLFMMPHMMTGQNMQIAPWAAYVVFKIFFLTLPVQTVVYWTLSFLKLKAHRRNIRKVVSSTGAVDLQWLQNFLWVLAGVIFLWLNLALFEIPVLREITPWLYLLSAYFLSFFALRQGEVYSFSKASRMEIQSLILETPERPVRQQRVNADELEDLKNRLENLMDTKKPYLDSTLSLPLLAEHIGISVHELSYLINEAYKENFFSFVNRYRIEESKRLLLSGAFERLNILGVAYESGFNSKTTFNTTFKKRMGLSPTEFVKAEGNNLQKKD